MEGASSVDRTSPSLTTPTSPHRTAPLSLTSYILLVLHGYPLTQRGAHQESRSSTSRRAADAEARMWSVWGSTVSTNARPVVTGELIGYRLLVFGRPAGRFCIPTRCRRRQPTREPDLCGSPRRRGVSLFMVIRNMSPRGRVKRRRCYLKHW